MNAAGANDISWFFVELGIAIVGLAVLTRLAIRVGVSAIPMYLLGGLAFGHGGFLPLEFGEAFIHDGAEIGVVLLLFMLGLEYTGQQLGANLRTAWRSGVLDLALNFPPGMIAGLLLGWDPIAALLLGGVTYISSSGIIAKVLMELRWHKRQEAQTVVPILIFEDLAMTVFLPLAAVLLIGQTIMAGLIAVSIALATVSVVLLISMRYGNALSRIVSHQSDEVLFLTTLGIVLLVAGIAQRLQISAAIGAFLVGIALSAPMSRRARRLFRPLHDLFAAIFFLFFGLQIDPATLPPVMAFALMLGLLTLVTKVLTGWWAARRAGVDSSGSLRAGALLVARGEFSIVIAGLGVSAGLEPELGPLSAAYVLLMAVTGPLLARVVELPFAKRG